MKKLLTKDFTISRLSKFFSSLNNIEIAIIFGSIVKKGRSIHDIDLAIKFTKKYDLLDLGELTTKIATTLNVHEDIVDLVDLENVNQLFLAKILNEGIVVKGSDESLKKLYEKAQTYPDALMDLRWSTLDPEPKPDKIVINSRVEEIRRNANFLKEEILTHKVEELSYKDILAFERAIHRIIEAMLDISRHLIAVYSLGLAESYGMYAKKLADAGKMPKNLAKDINKLAGLRNIIIHRYLEIDLKNSFKQQTKLLKKPYQNF